MRTNPAHVRMVAPVLVCIRIGDDETDEDACQALGTAGLGIPVGCDRLSSAAHYYVESVEQTVQCLAILGGLT